MGFSYNKAIELRPQKERALSTFFIAFFVSALIILPYIFLNGDFFKATAEQGFEQLGTFFLTPERLSKYYFPFGSVGFVVGAPIGLILSLIPAAALQYIGGAAMVLRISLSALFAYLFIRRFTRTPEAARLGSFLYAFSSAVIGITVNNQLQNLVVLFPLVLLAAEKLMTESRRVWLAVAVMGAALVNGHAALPLLIFLIAYVILRISSRDVKVDFSRAFGVFFEIIIGALSAAILFIPIAVVNAACTSPLEFTGIQALFRTGDAYLNILKSFFLPAEFSNGLLVADNSLRAHGLFGAYLPLLSMSGVIAYCGAKRGSAFKRIVIFSIVCLCVPILNKLFFIGNVAAGYMWFYMPALIFSLVSVMAFENREIPLGSGLKWSAAMTVIVSAIIAAYPQMNEYGGLTLGFFNNEGDIKANLIRFGIYVGIALIGIIATAIVLKAAESRDKSMFNALFVCAVLLSAALFWLYLATEVYYFESSLIPNHGGTLSDMLNVNIVNIPKLLHISMIISVAALGALAVYIIICIATHKKRRETEFSYPEGEELLELWLQYDEEDADGEDVEQEEEFSLESIAESLQMEYPVDVKPDEFKGGFNIVADIPEKKTVDTAE